MRALLLATSLALAMAGPEADARGPAAQALYEQGRAALDAGKHELAIKQLRALLRHPEAGDETDRWQALLALGLAYEAGGYAAEAIESYQRFMQRSAQRLELLDETWGERRRFVAESLALLLDRVLETHGAVSIETDPPGAALASGHRALGFDGGLAAPASTFLPPGRHVLTASLPGYVRARTEVRVVAGEQHAVQLVLAKVPAAGEPRPTPVAPVPSEEDRPGGPVAPWVLAGAGGGCLVVAGVLSVVAWDAREGQLRLGDPVSVAQLAQWDELDERREAARVASWVLYGVGAAAAVGGVVWALMVPGEDEAVVVTPVAGGGLLTARGSF